MLPAVRNAILTPNPITLALNVLRKFGTDAHVYIPGVGSLNGVQAGNWLESAGTTPATIDGLVGKVNDTFGAIAATQATTANKPVLRKGAVNSVLNTNFALGTIDGSPGTAPTNWSISSAPAGVVRTVAHGSNSNGSYLEVRMVGTNTSGSIAYPGVTSTAGLNPSALGVTWTGQSKIELVSGAWPNTATLNISEYTTGGGYLTASGTNIKTIVLPGNPPLFVNHTRTTSNASVGLVSLSCVTMSISIGEVVDFTFRVYNPQLELGSTATPYIPTTTAPASSGQGLSYWQFDGVNDYLSLGAVPFQMSDDHAIIACANARILNSRDILSIGSTLSANPLLRLGVQAGNYADFFSRDDANVSVELIGTSVILGSNAVIAAIKINNSRALRVNAVQEASSNKAVGASSVTVSAVGCRAIATPSAFWNGSIYCVIAIKGTVSDAELKTLERFAGLFGGVSIT